MEVEKKQISRWEIKARNTWNGGRGREMGRRREEGAMEERRASAGASAGKVQREWRWFWGSENERSWGSGCSHGYAKR